MSGIVGDNVGRSSGLTKSAAVSTDFVKIASTTASGSASTIDVDNCFDDSTYNYYSIRWQGLAVLTGGSTRIRVRLLDASGTVITGSSYRSYKFSGQATSGAVRTDTEKEWDSSFWKISHDYNGQYDDNYQPHSGEMQISAPESTLWKTTELTFCGPSDNGSSTAVGVNISCGVYNDTPIAHRGIRIYADSGNNFHSSGIVTVYGYK